MPGLESKISLSLTSRKPPGSSTTNLKRSRAALDDDDHDDNNLRHGEFQNVSHFDDAAGGAIDDSKPRADTGPMVIASQKNRDWKEAAAGQRKRQKSGLPREESQTDRERKEREIEAIDAAKKPSFGLSVRKRPEEGGEELNGDASYQAGVVNDDKHLGNGIAAKIKTDGERAIDALLEREEQSTLVLPAMDEEEVYSRDVQSAPDMASLDDYVRVPVEQFGAALLRGMGWKDGEGIGSQRGQKIQKASIPKRRPALLGIGAKEDAAVAQELGTWGKAAKKGGEVKIYNPVLLRDKKTGEVFTEEELEQKKAKAEREQYELEFEQRDKRERRREGRERSTERSNKRHYDSREDRNGTDSRHRDRRDRDESEDRYRSRKDERDRRRDRSSDRRDHRRDDDRRRRERRYDDRDDDDRDRRHGHRSGRDRDYDRYRR